MVILKLLQNIFRADWYQKKNKNVKIMENYSSCLVSSCIHNIVRIYNQVLMASTKFNSKKKSFIWCIKC